MRDFVRGAVRLHILHHAAEQEIHGAWMTEELARHGYRISPGTLYPTLHRLEGEGLLTSRQEAVDGKVRRLYRATDAGHAALAEDRAALAELVREVLPGFRVVQTGPAGAGAAASGADGAHREASTESR
ncbi:helix-turn-helix transcriptional regulator [Actinospica sp. MGRD01-02]|uniref:Helix-turn-helix transcriptional regulator n=1 Tax=Actinospica acidithermotolerans TaxID=2828514 RepID=A0A941E9U8_9ACTN|nr:PadR family transcriptional regulator [Actinospica acidithermotolerans]MBR7826658.1 helix-turn-helix transcriptional regulator [Actinospica acidithermotolerans]